MTTSPVPIGDVDRPLLDMATERVGLDAEWVSWRDATVDWGTFDAVLIHSTWDYHEALGEFLAWAERVDELSRLVNPVEVVRWNAHKRYLLDLAATGVPVVPTVVVPQAEPESLACVADARGWAEVVVKPAVGAGAVGAGRFRIDEPAGERALASVLTSSDALVQPFLTEIESRGETSVLVLGGEVTHAVGKVPRSGDFRVQEHHGGTERAVAPTAAELELAALATAAVAEIAPVHYARVDCVTVDGRPHLMELEVIEPSLYLPFASPETADRLMAALLADI